MTQVVHNLKLRPERESDVPAIGLVNRLAFGRQGEAMLVDALRANGAVRLSMVAELAGEVVAHILFSPVRIERDGCLDLAVGLGPMAVSPAWQQQGIGAALIGAGTDVLRHAGEGAIVVLGHPRYYPKFGFVPASRFALRCEFGGPDEAFMALELRAGYLRPGSGVVHFRPEFAAVA